MKVFLCEKPSQAQDLAEHLGAPLVRSTHIETSGGVVTWASGHLLELLKPDAIDPRFKKWNAADLPIIPNTFTWQPRPGKTIDQLHAIGELLKKATSVVLATDAEPQGELIGRNILNFYSYTGPLLRAWLKALDPVSIDHALNNLLPGDEKLPLYEAALTRSKSDWLVGMNGTRAATIQFATPGETLPVGRVQTPTLAMIVNRDNYIKSFVPAPITDMTIVASNDSGSQTLTLEKPDGFTPAASNASSVMHRDIQVDVDQKEVSTPPPPLFNLSGLQQRCCSLWGWSADHTLKIAQRLYEHHKILSYPRTDSTVLPSEQTVLIPKTLAALSSTPLSDIPSFDPVIRPETFVSDLGPAHHAIVPTTLKPNLRTLSTDEHRAYLLVAKSYVAAIHEDCKSLVVTNSATIENLSFSATGSEIISAGWRSVGALPVSTVPFFPKSSAATITSSEINHSQTTPPDGYTDGTLIKDMTNIRQFVSRPDVLAKLPSNVSLGTEATRAGIIEGLCDDGLLTRDGVNLTSTPKARALVAVLQDHAPRLVDPTETAVWECGLKKIEDGSLAPDRFLHGIVARVQGYTNAILSAPRPKIAPESVTAGTVTQTICPLSGLPVRDTGAAWVFPGASNVFCPKVYAKRKMSPEIYRDAFSEDGTPVIEGFTSKAGRPFSAALKFSEESGRIGFVFKNDRREFPSKSDAATPSPARSPGDGFSKVKF